MNSPALTSIAIAGTTAHTVMCAQSLLDSGKFSIPWVLTPIPKPIGRKKVLTKNPLHLWAEKNAIPVILVKKKIDETIRKKLLRSDSGPVYTGPRLSPDEIGARLPTPQFLLVIDFGYLIPQWLLDLPSIAPLNIHPSQLPKYRGSSPGQFALLYGEKSSAVTVMKMSAGLDTGDILRQLPFTVQQTWNATDYYQHAFTLVSAELPEIIENVVKTPTEHRNELFVPQPEESPTPIARRLTKEDGFIPWILLKKLFSSANEQELNEYISNENDNFSPLIREVFSDSGPVDTGPRLSPDIIETRQLTRVIADAVRALSPWPNVWTIVPTTKGDKRMKILEVETHSNASLHLTKVHLEGLQPTTFEAIKNQIV